MARRRLPRIIGGMFPLPDMLKFGHSPPPFLDGRTLTLVNGQSSIRVLIEGLKPPNVWLPSYLCDSVLEAARRDGTRVRFYALDYDLAISSPEWLDEVRRGDVVVFIDFFGFPCNVSDIDRARAQGAWVLEDACQALLTGGVTRKADFVVFSPRKFLGVPDGGILKLNCEVEFRGVGHEDPPIDWWLRAVEASVLRREFDIYGGNRRWFELFQESEEEAPLGDYAMSDFSRTLLMHCFDYAQISTRRRTNYAALSEALPRFAMFRNLPADVVPLGFPMRTEKRDHLQQGLFAHEIYPAVHWPVEGIIPLEFSASHRLAADILTLPCDQRYDVDDMGRIAELVQEISAS